MEANEVHAAFEILLEEIEAVANALKDSGAEAFRAGDYERARQAIEEAARLTEFREKVKALQREWASFSAKGIKRPRRKATRRATDKLQRGVRTTEDDFRRPILEALVELGGSARIGEVLERVEAKMKHVLNEYDWQPLPLEPNSVRWKNTAQWSRHRLVREGLMKSDSPRGIWEISEAGRRWLEHESP